MATITLGTAATTTLTALTFQSGGLSAADVATIAAGIKYDQNPGGPAGQVYPGAFSQRGILYVPARGWLTILPGDIVAFDSATGWPILVSKKAAAGAGWVHS